MTKKKALKKILRRLKWMILFRLRWLIHPGERKNNVALVVNGFNKGGLEQVVLNLYLGYKKQGMDACLLSETRDVGQMADSLKSVRDIYIYDGNEEEFYRFCWKRHVGILHYHYNVFNMRTARTIGFKIIYTMHNVYTWMNDEEIKLRADCLRYANYVVPVSTFVEQYFLKRTGMSNTNFHTITNGIDFEELSQNYTSIPTTRKSLGLADDDIVVAQIASFFPVKHQIGLIGVMEQVVKVNPKIKMLLVGNIGEAGIYQEFQRLRASSPARDNILEVPYFEHKYMGQFLRENVDIFTLATLQEGCSNAVLEAIYCAKPMVLTNVGNAMDVKDSTSCIVTATAYPDVTKVTNAEILQIAMQKDNTNTNELADAFIKMAAELPQYRAKAEEAARHSDEYGTETMVKKYIDLIKE